MNPTIEGLGLIPGVVEPDKDCVSPKPQWLQRPRVTAEMCFTTQPPFPIKHLNSFYDASAN